MNNNFTTETFGRNVFDYNKMRKYLPRLTFKAIVAAHELNVKPSERDAEAYAEALKEWALSRGITRYTHWFQPLNNFTAEKRDSLSSLNKEGNACVKFRGKELQRGEGDASSLPNGGMRETFEARGITQWDYTAFAFIKGDCLCIPTTFCGAGGETLDKKTPLINSGIALNAQALRVLKALGMPAKRVKSVVGAEQEYFLIDKTLFDKRKDLVYTGRTLFGKMPPKGQEFEDHYFRPPTDKVIRFMQEADLELWKLGILVKTEHNEVAPCQYELAPCYTQAALACDQNQLVMETLKNVATKHGLACLLHEKPFDKINGSGKHNNWSLLTDDDVNLLDKGNTPEQHARFLLMISAIVKAVDEYNTLLVSSVTTASNDLRLGGFEAPPRILTVYLGERLTEAINNVINSDFQFGKSWLSDDIYSPDRNRTSPLAYTGNKFEFRMVGSSACIADVNTTFNTIVAESLRCFADELEQSTDVWQTAKEIVAKTFANHSRVVYNGNGYSADWIDEATKRGLNHTSSAAILEKMTDDKAVDLFERHKVLTARELIARRDIRLKTYCDTVHLESIVACEIYERQICYCAQTYALETAQLAHYKLGIDLPIETEKDKIEQLDKLQKECVRVVEDIRRVLAESENLDLLAKTELYGQTIREHLRKLRQYVNELEKICPKNNWALPTYGQLLFGEK